MGLGLSVTELLARGDRDKCGQARGDCGIDQCTYGAQRGCVCKSETSVKGVSLDLGSRTCRNSTPVKLTVINLL